MTASPIPQKLGEISALWQAVLTTQGTLGAIEKLFLENKDLPACIIKAGLDVVGIFSRNAFAEVLSRPFAREVYIKRTIANLVEIGIVDTAPLVLPAEMAVAAGVEAALSRSSALAHEPVIVVKDGISLILEIDTLLRIQSALLQETISTKDKLLQEVQRSADELRNARDLLLKSEEHLEGEVLKRTLELEKINSNLVHRQKQIDEELIVARTLQQSILPTSLPTHPAYEGHAFMRAARMIGGDFYDAFALDEHRIGFIVADISGKGVPAALFMVLVRSVFQELAQQAVSPSACLAQANAKICARNPLSLFVTLVYGVLDNRTGEFVFCNGGHLMPYILRSGGAIEQLTQRPSPLVGLLDNATYTEHTVTLAADDRLLLITDGVTECFNSDDEVFGEMRLLHILQNSHSLTIKELLGEIDLSLEKFSKNIPASDDVTALAIHYLGMP